MGENKYKKGQIYKIVSPDFSMCYVGSTTEGLSRRLARHKASYNYKQKYGKKKDCSCFKLFNEFGADNCKIYWIEDYPCNSKKELEAREGFYIQHMECVNTNVAGRPRSEWHKEYREKNKERLDEYYKEWSEHNKEHLQEYRKEYRENNIEHMKEKSKQWRDTHKEHKRETNRLYRERNKEILREKEKIPFNCGCGSTVQKTEKARHEKTKKHQEWLQQQEQPEQEPEEN